MSEGAERAGPALVVGLTGGIGSGKSSVARRFARLGVPIIDADALARDVVAPGEPALEEIVATFGRAILDAAGGLDRAALRARVFACTGDRERLERIVHPRVRQHMRAALAALESPYAVVEIPLLVESGQHDLVDRVLVVEASEQTRIERARARDGTERSDIERIIAAQASAHDRRAAADDVIDNEGPPQMLGEAVAILHQRYLELSRLARLPDGSRR